MDGQINTNYVVIIVLALNAIWIAGFTFFWQADSKNKTANIKECVKDEACIERMKALALQEELRKALIKQGVDKDIKTINEDIAVLKKLYNVHKHNKENGKVEVEGGDII